MYVVPYHDTKNKNKKKCCTCCTHNFMGSCHLILLNMWCLEAALHRPNLISMHSPKLEFFVFFCFNLSLLLESIVLAY